MPNIVVDQFCANTAYETQLMMDKKCQLWLWLVRIGLNWDGFLKPKSKLIFEKPYLKLNP
jgi:hypothetical protein